MQGPNPTAYGHLVDVLSFKWLIYIQNGGHIYFIKFRGQNFLDSVYVCMYVCIVARDLPGGKRIRIINMRAHI